MDPRLTPYPRYRAALSGLHHTLTALPAFQPALQATVADLGVPVVPGGDLPAMWRGAVLDQALRSPAHGLLSGHRHRLRTTPTPAEALVIAASLRARFRVLNVRAVLPGVGVSVVDGLRGQGMELVDAGLARSASVGVTLAGWILVMPELVMSTGGLIPVSPAGLDAIGAAIQAGALSADRAAITAQDDAAEFAMAATILRCLCAESRG